MADPACTCHPVPEQYHTTHYGATEPGSTLEPDYGCAVHFPKVRPKRKWGDAPAHLAKTPAGCWHWTCTICPVWAHRSGCRADLALAVTALAEHQKAEHPVEVGWVTILDSLADRPAALTGGAA